MNDKTTQDNNQEAREGGENKPSDEQVANAVRAYVNAGKRGCDLYGAMKAALAEVAATQQAGAAVPSTPAAFAKRYVELSDENRALRARIAELEAAPTDTGVAGAGEVKTWQERCGDTGPTPSLDEAARAMKAEIADLRAQLARDREDAVKYRFLVASDVHDGQGGLTDNLDDERVLFEARYRDLFARGKLVGPIKMMFSRSPAGNYEHMYTGAYWHGWRERAILARQAAPTVETVSCPRGCKGPEQGGSGCMAVTGDCAMDAVEVSEAKSAKAFDIAFGIKDLPQAQAERAAVPEGDCDKCSGINGHHDERCATQAGVIYQVMEGEFGEYWGDADRAGYEAAQAEGITTRIVFAAPAAQEGKALEPADKCVTCGVAVDQHSAYILRGTKYCAKCAQTSAQVDAPEGGTK